MRNAKIVCTLGPVSNEVGDVEALARAGMAVGRVNASHGTIEERSDLYDAIRAVDERTDGPLASLLDLQGPEVRTAPLSGSIEVQTDSLVRFVEGARAAPDEIGLSVSISAAEPGNRILLDDGRITATVVDVDGETVIARIDSGGELEGRAGVNLPGIDLDLDVVTAADRRDLDLAVEKCVDFVAASFVRDAADVYAVSAVLERLGAEIPIIAKIERADAVEALDEIIEASYGIMVARGDLGVECPMEEVPMIQKRIIRRSRDAGVPVITATEMLDSMIHARRPTRAEASDVANAVLDGTDALMLSAETAIGDHPVRVVEAMDRIVRQVERSDEYAELRDQRVAPPGDTKTDALARSARYLARDVGASAIVAASESGYTARKTAKFRPPVPVIASTPSERVRRQLALSWGVTSRYASYADAGADDVIENAVQASLDAGVAKSGDTVVVLSGMMTELEGTNTTNVLKVHVAAETVAMGRAVVPGRVSGPLARSSDGDLSNVPDGAVLALTTEFDGEFDGDLDRLAGIVDAHPGLTGYSAMVAREIDVPMVSGAVVDDEISEGAIVTIDGERGLVYEGEIATIDPDLDRRDSTM